MSLASPTTVLRRTLRPAVRLAREVPLWPRLVRRGRGAAPRVVALPAKGREDGAAALRIHDVSDGLRALGWQVLVLPPALTLAQRRRMIGAFGPDVLLMQGVRHGLNRPDLYPGIPIVMDMDDADFHLAHLVGPLAEAMPRIACLIAGSRYIADWGRGAGAPRTEVVWTGTPVSPRPHSPQSVRGPVIAWGQTRPMTYVREAALVRKVTRRVAEARPGVTLRLYDRRAGDDPEFARSFAAPGLTVEWCAAMPYDTYLASFDDVAVGLAPLCPETPFSRGKSFGKVLAYLDRKVAVVGSEAGEHGAFFTGETGVITNDPSRWKHGVAALLDDAGARGAQADAAYDAFQDHLTTPCAVRSVATCLSAVSGRPLAGDRSRESA